MCREVLTRLKHSEGVSEEEEWLLTRLSVPQKFHEIPAVPIVALPSTRKRRFQQPWYQCRGDSSKEARELAVFSSEVSSFSYVLVTAMA